MRILVTGHGGFVGRHVAAVMRALHPEASLLPLPCDITDHAAVRASVAALQPELCLHLAAIAAIGVARDQPDHAWAVNLHGTLGLARAIRSEAPGCRLLFVSSADAYGLSFQGGLPLDERAALAPLNVYGATKAAADLALGAMAADGLHVIRLRPFNHIGPGQTADFAIPAFARQIARIEAGRQEPVIRTGNLSPRRDFLDVRDVARAYAAVLARAGDLPAGQILNIASGTSRGVGEMLERLLAIAGVAARIETEASRARPTDIAVAAGDAGAARSLLGWAPAMPLDQTLADILADWRERVAAES